MDKGTEMDAKQEAEDIPIATSQTTAQVPVALARRRLLRGGLSAVPVILTVSSRSVMASSTDRCTPASSFASINTSRPDETFSCIGRTPGYWKQPQYFSQWPNGYQPEGPNATKFNDIFGSNGGYPGKTLLEVLNFKGGGTIAVARHVVAAVLNAASNKTPSTILSVQMVKDLWSDYVAQGYYEPTAGIKWYADYSVPAGNGSLIEWLTTTMPV